MPVGHHHGANVVEIDGISRDKRVDNDCRHRPIGTLGLYRQRSIVCGVRVFNDRGRRRSRGGDRWRAMIVSIPELLPPSVGIRKRGGALALIVNAVVIDGWMQRKIGRYRDLISSVKIEQRRANG